MLFSDRDTASIINYGTMRLQLISSEPDVLPSPSSGRAFQAGGPCRTTVFEKGPY